jgi:hypothetical protein
MVESFQGERHYARMSGQHFSRLNARVMKRIANGQALGNLPDHRAGKQQTQSRIVPDS